MVFQLSKISPKRLSIYGLDETQATKILSDEKMTPEKWQKIKSLFEAAQEIAPDKREKFLENACGADDDLKKEVEKLLGSFDEAETFMEKPAVAEAASMFEEKKTLAAKSNDGRDEKRKIRRRNDFRKPLPHHRAFGKRRNGRSFSRRRFEIKTGSRAQISARKLGKKRSRSQQIYRRSPHRTAGFTPERLPRFRHRRHQREAFSLDGIC